MLTIILSGPKASAPQARTALAGVGLDVQPVSRGHGLPDTATGEPSQEPQAFVTVHGEDVNAAADAVRPLGWALRMHHDRPEPLSPTPEQQMAAEIAELKARLAALEAR